MISWLLRKEFAKINQSIDHAEGRLLRLSMAQERLDANTIRQGMGLAAHHRYEDIEKILFGDD
jgi:hypothetical protein